MKDKQFIVELRLPSGRVFRRTQRPMSKEAAEEEVARHKEAESYSAHIVPAEKWIFRGVRQRVETPDTVKPNAYRSRVE